MDTTNAGAGDNLPAIPATDMLLRLALPGEAATDPYRAYLDQLESGNSKTAMAGCLDRVAKMIIEGEAGPLPPDVPRITGAGRAWWMLRRPHTLHLRSLLIKLDYSPATVNLHLAALRGVLRECWNLGLMSTDDYLRAKSIRGIKAVRLPKGRSIHPDEMAALLASAVTSRPPPADTIATVLDGVLREHGPLKRTDAIRMTREASGQDCSTSAVDQAYQVLQRAGAAKPGAGHGQWATTGRPLELPDWDRPLRYRDSAMLTLMECTGMRTVEVAAARIEDYDAKERSLTIIGKGNKQRRVWVHQDAVPALERWLALVGERSGPMFRPVGRWGAISPQSISVSSVGKIVDRHRTRAGVAPLSPHDFRRTLIGELYEAGGDSQQAKRIAGHASSATTDLYDKRGDRGLRDLVDRVPIVAPPESEGSNQNETTDGQ